MGNRRLRAELAFRCVRDVVGCRSSAVVTAAPGTTLFLVERDLCVCVCRYGRTACCGEVGHVVVVVCERASPHRVLSRVPRCHRACVLPY